MIKKLRWRLVWFTMVIVLISIVAILYINFASTRQSLAEESRSYLEDVLSEQMPDHRPGSKAHGSELQSPYFIVVVDSHGKIRVETNGFFTFDDELLIEIVTAAYYSDGDSGVLNEYNLRYDSRHEPAGTRIAFVDMSVEQSTLRTMLINSVYIAVGAILAAFLLLLFFSKRLVRPIELSIERQRRFVADASHELKTPLAVIMANAELLTAGSEDDSKTARRLENICEESARMRRLVERLLDQAKADEEPLVRTLEETDLSNIVSESVLLFEPVAYENGKGLQYEIDEGIFIKGDDERIRQLVAILLDNAIKYSSAKSSVLVELLLEKRSPVLRVSNFGDDIAADDLERIFDRFFRADKSRKGDGSYGLGLSIAKGIAEAHGARISAQSENGCTVFTVTFPKKHGRNQLPPPAAPSQLPS